MLDASVLLSFDAHGYRRHAQDFLAGDLDVDLSGKVCCVTGANAGIGLQTARGLAQRGATVYLLCRNEGRGLAARDELRKSTANPNVHLQLVDLSSMASIRTFADRFSEPVVHRLVHNAGVMVHRRTVTEEGLELTWATNVFGPFLLSRCLQERLARAEGARVVWVSSGGMYTQTLNLADLGWQSRAYDGVQAYAQSKRAEVMLSERMARELAGTGVMVHAMHPGWADTNSVQLALPRFYKVTRRILRTAEQGADTVIWLCVCSRLEQETGRFWFDRALAPTHLMKRTQAGDALSDELYALCLRTADA